VSEIVVEALYVVVKPYATILEESSSVVQEILVEVELGVESVDEIVGAVISVVVPDPETGLPAPELFTALTLKS
jgi:hypothetical protein